MKRVRITEFQHQRALDLGDELEEFRGVMHELSSYKVGWEEPGSAETIAYHALGLAEEAGEVAGEVKKGLRKLDPFARRDQIVEELGDVMFYWIQVAYQTGLPMSEILRRHLVKLRTRQLETRAAEAAAAKEEKRQARERRERDRRRATLERQRREQRGLPHSVGGRSL